MPTLYIIRHAHKQRGDFYNPRLRHQDEPISQPGQKESRRLWSYLSDKQIAAIYVSGYQRTAQTIQYVAEQLGITSIIDERLNEIDSGCIEGISDEAIQQEYPEVWTGFRER